MRRRTHETTPGAGSLATLRRRLLAFYDRQGRDLPWRRTRDPWAILVSEVMLQQTTVAAAIPYYERLLARWPCPGDLARAGRDELLSEWAGLGYYRRAHMLHRAACRVAEAGGRLPETRAGLRELPGIGEYTSAAVASIAYGEPVAAVDGNVQRVIARLLALPGDPRRADAHRTLEATARALIGTHRPGDANQALMELGATVCRPTTPDCGRCPLASACVARAAGTQQDFPQVAPRRQTLAVLVAAAVVRRGARVLLARRSAAPNAGFWELPQLELARGPAAETPPPERGAGSPRRRLAAHLQRAHALRAAVGPALPPHRHAITHHRIRVLPFEAALSGGRVRAPLAWLEPGPQQPITTASRRILAAALGAPALPQRALPARAGAAQ
jgi:A/G-specific adenine glycosylase